MRTTSRLALAATARVVPIDGGLVAATTDGTLVLECDLTFDRAEQLLRMLDGRTTVAAIAASLGITRASVRELVGAFAEAGLLAGPEPQRAADGDVALACDGELGRAVLAHVLASTTSRVWLWDPGQRIACASRRVERVRELAQAARSARVVVCCVEQPGALLDDVARIATEARVAWLSVRVTEVGYELGPACLGEHVGARDGCACCAELYRAATDDFARVAGAYGRMQRRPLRWRVAHEPAALAAVAALAAAWIQRIAAGGERWDHDAGDVTRIDRRSSVTRGRAVQHPGCPLAPTSAIPACDADRAAAAFAEGMRDGEPVELRELAARLAPLASPGAVGPFGPAQPLTREQRGRLCAFVRERGVPVATSLLAHAHHVKTYLPALGDTCAGVDLLDPDAAHALAIVEGIERLACFATPIATERHAYRDVADRALDPASLPAVRGGDPAQPIDWVWGVDAATGEPVRVPADVVRPGRAGEAIAVCTSSGAACHTSLPHAILNGLYEALERDAFLIAWLNGLSLPRVELARDPLGVFAEWNALGMTLDFVDLTTDLGVPILLVAARDRANPDRFLTTFAAGRTPAAIAARLAVELVQFALLALVAPPGRGEHFHAYQDRAQIAHAAFLTANRTVSAFADHAYFAQSAGDARAELDHLIARLATHGHRVVVIDLTTAWTRSLGLRVVRVVVPGLVPMYFGREHRPLRGRRLYEAPRRMGVRDRDTVVDDLVAWEHPFA